MDIEKVALLKEVNSFALHNDNFLDVCTFSNASICGWFNEWSTI